MSSDSTKTRILSAAGPIFAEKGPRNATVREICSAADVNVASINYYFQDKDNLYLETVRYARNFQASRNPFPDWDEAVDPRQKLNGFIHTLLKRIVALGDAPWQVRLMMNEVLTPTEVCQDMVEGYFRPVFEMLLSIVDDLSPRKLSESSRLKIGFSIIGQCVFYRYSSAVVAVFIDGSDKKEFDLKPLAEHISTFCISAIESGLWEEQPFEPAGRN